MKPTHRLKMKARATNDKTSAEIGVGWQNEDGSISLVLHMGTELSWRDKGETILTLFPVRDE